MTRDHVSAAPFFTPEGIDCAGPSVGGIATRQNDCPPCPLLFDCLSCLLYFSLTEPASPPSGTANADAAADAAADAGPCFGGVYPENSAK